MPRSLILSWGLIIGVCSSVTVPAVAQQLGVEGSESANGDGDLCIVVSPTTIRCGDGLVIYVDGSENDAEPQPPGLSNRSAADLEYFHYTRIVPNGGQNGETCRIAGTVIVPRGAPTGLLPHNAGSFDISRTYPECPMAPGAQSEQATRASYAVEYWKTATLPKPQPFIAPGRAITGMYAYLETRGTTTHTYTEPNTPFGPLTIVATGRYYVDWGDGTNTGPHAGEGQPWPDGDIKHEYINIGVYDIVVTERWTATWSFGSESGVLDELRTIGTIEDFPVQQIQAVVLR